MGETEVKEQDVADLASMIHSPGWVRIIKPQLEAARDQLMNCLVFGGAKDNNGNPISDEQLKARIRDFTWMLAWEVRYSEWKNQLDQLVAAPEPEPDPAGNPYNEEVQFGLT